MQNSYDSSGNSAVNPDTISENSVSESSVDSLVNSDYTNYWIVIADSGMNYDSLLGEMNYLSANLDLPIDSMGRCFNRKKNLISLPDDDPDEMYAGEYYPRRYESDYLSIEYLNWYSGQSSDKMMALVAGVLNRESSADSLFNKLKLVNSSAYKFKTKLYTGCMH